MMRALRLLLPSSILLLLVAASGARAGVRDSLFVLQTPSGSYITCYDINVLNRQTDTSVRISDFRLRIISGRATLLAGLSDSPPAWSIVSQSLNAIQWTSNTAAADIRPGRTAFGFHFCIADTGIFRVVWETRDLDGVISTDTLVLAGRHADCDEAFFRTVPSLSRSIVDVDVVAGNGTGRLINDIRFHMITPGVSFSAAAGTVPAGWVRLRIKPDTIGYFTNSKALDYNQFVEGFRLEVLGAQPDSLVQIEWLTTNYGDIICHDTASLHFGLARRDSLVRMGAATSTDVGCCFDFNLKNTHAPATPIDMVTMKIATAGVRIDSLPTVPEGWSIRAVGVDSAVITIPARMSSGDTALIKQFCFNNIAAVSDSIRLRWYTYTSGIDVTPGLATVVCFRPFINCDSLAAVVDSTTPAAHRCISLFLKNRNSRKDQIKGFTVHISNAGLARTVYSASAPSPWRVAAFGGDSVIFTSGTTVAGQTAGPFTICTSLGDATTQDPLVLAWTTSHYPGATCSDTLRVNAIIRVDIDTVRARQIMSADTARCCFEVRVLNSNQKGRSINHFRLEVDPARQVIFTSAGAQAPWHANDTLLPDFSVDYRGDAVAHGDALPLLTLCVDAHLLGNRPVSIPVLWRTYDDNGQINSDTVHLICGDHPNDVCDSLHRTDSVFAATNECQTTYRIVNQHQPPGSFDGFTFRILDDPPRARIVHVGVEGGATAWTTVTANDTMAELQGPPVAPGDTLASIVIRVQSTGQSMVEECTLDHGAVICCAVRTINCGDADVRFDARPTGFHLLEVVPNPAVNRATVRYELLRAGEATLRITDQRGAVVRSRSLGRHEAGASEATVDLAGLAAGVYYCAIEMGGERESAKIVVVR